MAVKAVLIVAQLWFIAGLSMALQLDPIANMCFRFDHQSVIFNHTLYIDGGTEVFIDVIDGQQQGNVTLGYNEYLIEIDLSKPFNWHDSITERAVHKRPNPATDTSVPQRVRGALFEGAANDTNIYMYGGTTSWWNTTFKGFEPPGSQSYAMWSYDTTSGEWDQYDVSSGSPWIPSSGASATAPELGLAFYFNGEIDSGSSQTTQILGDEVKIFLQGMIVVNTTTHTAFNLSTSAVSDQPRTRGSLTYVPDIGSHGILVYFGGTYKPIDELDSEEYPNFIDLSHIDIFDVSSAQPNASAGGAWYKQNTTGTTPGQRADFCSVLVSASDNSSHNIYIYGGKGPANTYYDDVWVLSMPSFTWTKVFGPGGSPRFGHTCHLAGNAQMITVGGISSWGPNAPCDWESKGVGIFNLSSLIWGSQYDPQDSPYVIPQQVLANIGGANGSAMMTQPKSGFASPSLGSLFGVRSVSPSPTAVATPSGEDGKPSKDSLNVGAIVGGAVGGAISLAALFALLWFIARRRQKRTADETPSTFVDKNDPRYVEASGGGSTNL